MTGHILRGACAACQLSTQPKCSRPGARMGRGDSPGYAAPTWRRGLRGHRPRGVAWVIEGALRRPIPGAEEARRDTRRAGAVARGIVGVVAYEREARPSDRFTAGDRSPLAAIAALCPAAIEELPPRPPAST